MFDGFNLQAWVSLQWRLRNMSWDEMFYIIIKYIMIISCALQLILLHNMHKMPLVFVIENVFDPVKTYSNYFIAVLNGFPAMWAKWNILNVCACDLEEHLWTFYMLFLSVKVQL